jgi:hypothetical protein
MARDFQPHAVGFIDNRLNLLQCQRGDGDQRAILSEFTEARADEILGRVNLHPVHAVQLRFANGGAAQPGRVHVLAFGEPFEETS